MTILNYASGPGPGTIDIQIEEGCDFSLNLTLGLNSNPWDLTGATVSADISTKWSPGGKALPMVATITGLPTAGTVTVSLPGSATAGISQSGLPFPERSVNGYLKARQFHFGGWAFYITQGGITQRILEGKVILDRDPTT